MMMSTMGDVLGGAQIGLVFGKDSAFCGVRNRVHSGERSGVRSGLCNEEVLNILHGTRDLG